MLRVWVLSLLLVVMVGAPAVAEDEDEILGSEFGRTGYYLGIGFAGGYYSRFEDSVQNSLRDALNESFVVQIEVPVGIDARVGWRGHERIAAEVQFQWLSKGNVTIDGFDAGNLDLFTVMANAKAYVMTERIQPWVLLGMGLTHYVFSESLGIDEKLSRDAFTIQVGTGVDYYITPNILAALDFTYVIPADESVALDHISYSLGLQYRF